MIPRRVYPDDPDLTAILTMMREGFAYMDGIIDPPSSIHRLDIPALQDAAKTGELWALPQACVLLTPQPDTLYLGKLTTNAAHRAQGLARSLVEHAVARAQALDLPSITLESRIELTDNHAAFAAMGFVETARTAHPGFTRPTSITFTRTV